MNEKDYIESLENLLIFMCQIYEETQKALTQLSKEENNDALFKVPMIQGTENVIGISRLSTSVFKQPDYNFIEINDELKRRRGR